MGILGNFFGGGDSDVESKIVPPKYLEKYLKPYARGLTGAFEQTLATPPWTTPAYTGLGPLEQAGIAANLEYLPYLGGNIDAYQGMLSQGANPYANPYLAGAYGTTMGAINDAMGAAPNLDIWGDVYSDMAGNIMETFQESVLPALRADAQAAGQFGQSRHRLATEGAVGELTDSLSSLGTQLGQRAASEAVGTRNLGRQMAGGMFGSTYSPSLSFSSNMASLMPQGFTLGQMPFDRMLQLGGMQTGANERAVREAERIYGGARMDPMSLYGTYGGLLSAPLSGAPVGQNQRTSGAGMNVADLAMLGLGGYGIGRGFGWFGGNPAAGIAGMGGLPFS